MRDAVHLGVKAAGVARLESRSRHVPLEKVNLPSGAGGDVHELVDEEALPRARQAGHENHSPLGQATELFREASIRADHQTVAPPAICGSTGRVQLPRPSQTSSCPGGKGTPRPFSKRPYTNAKPARLRPTLTGQRSRAARK